MTAHAGTVSSGRDLGELPFAATQFASLRYRESWGRAELRCAAALLVIGSIQDTIVEGKA